MAKLSINRYSSSKNNTGLTLIEVLIALAIMGIAMTAVIKASSQSIRSTAHLQEKTIALWVAQQALNEIRVGVLKPMENEELHQTTEMLGQYWYTHIHQEDTPNKRIKKVVAKVFKQDTDNEDETPLIGMETYLYYGQ